MDNDDEPVGRLLTRREMLKLLATVGVATAAGCGPRLSGGDAATPASGQAAATNAPTGVPATEIPATAANPIPACVVRPEQTEGPYFVDVQLDRSDIRDDPTGGATRPGVPLALTFVVSRIGRTCEPLPGATVDVWHCDAEGVYSGVQDRNFGDTGGTKFLRGHQVTGDDGTAAFTTIYPGWYRGRAVHIHFKIRTEEDGRNFEFTSQLYFDDALSDEIFTRPPYAGRGDRDTLNADDGIFRTGGELLTLDARPSGDGYAAVFDIGLQM